jgi:hypothetical protein|tara:strand:- start:6 stop:254 length:249 start_codon:yes stop_codon:yes gene_type:complete
MKKVLSEYYGNGNNRIARVLIETIGDEKKFYVDYSTTDLWMNPVTDPSMQEWPIDATVEKSTERDAEDFAEDFVLYNKSVSE